MLASFSNNDNCKIITVPLDKTGSYDYTLTFDLTGSSTSTGSSASTTYTETISGTMSVIACGETIPSSYIDRITSSLTSSLKGATGKITFDALPAPSNVNCTLTSYSF